MTYRTVNLGDKLKQQLISETEGKQSMTNPNNTQSDNKYVNEDPAETSDMNDMEDSEMDMVEEVTEEAETDDSAVDSVFGGGTAQPISIDAKLIVNVCADEVGELPNKISIHGTYYNVNSPLRKGKGTVDNGYGLIRDTLSQVAEYISTINNNNTVFFGNSDFQNNIDSMVSFYANGINNIMYSPFEGETVKVRALQPVPVEEEVEEDDMPTDLDNVSLSSTVGSVKEMDVSNASVKFNDVPLTDAFTLTSHVSARREEDGSLTIMPVFTINIKIPLLLKYADSTRSDFNESALSGALKSISKIAHLIVNSNEMDPSDMLMTFAMNSGDILDPAYITVLNDFSERTQVISNAYLEEVSKHPSKDTLGIYPFDSSIEEAKSKLMPFGNEFFIIL